jgi:AcrR family transcriptional regulator
MSIVVYITPGSAYRGRLDNEREIVTRETAGTTDEARGPARSRDATDTRRRLLEAARRRFARDGYTGTTVRDIAADAGVNVALINRYFTSKEGLFETCLRQAVEDLDQPVVDERSVEQTAERIVHQLVGLPAGAGSLQLLLLLRSSGDERADRIRRSTLMTFAEGLAGAAGANPAASPASLLRAQVALSTVLGVALLRSSAAIEPLTSATVEDLRGPMTDVISTLLRA